MIRPDAVTTPGAGLPGGGAPEVEAPPRHIAIIMDGNGRWASRRGLPRVEGHRRGAGVVRAVTEECARLGVAELTLFSFSTENWRRPRAEVSFLMRLLARHLRTERKTIMGQGLRFAVVGRREGLPDRVLAQADALAAESASNSGMVLRLALNYGGRAELADAAARLACEAAAGALDPERIDEAALAARLYDPAMADPDLLIRTGGERRLSNFLLWQAAYSELYFSDAYWPDFGLEDLHEAIRDYQGRHRRYGGIGPATGARAGTGTGTCAGTGRP